MRNPPLIGIVGVCAAGKSTLITGLTREGFFCRHIAQEHSYVPDMWKQLANPDILVYLDVSYESTLQRKDLNWSFAEFEQQRFRLCDARKNAQIVVPTDFLSPEEVLSLVVSKINDLTRKS
jgi:hypothetical protein